IVLTLRSAHAEDAPQTRTRVRAPRRMRTGHCVYPHTSRRIAARRGCGTICARVALRCSLSMRAGVGTRIAAMSSDHLNSVTCSTFPSWRGVLGSIVATEAKPYDLGRDGDSR